MKTPLGWKREILNNVSVIQTGLAKGKVVSNSPARLPYLRVANVQDGFLDLTEIKEIEVEQSQIERYRLFPGDILLTEGGDRDKLGRGTLWEGQIPLCLHQNHIFVVRSNENIIFNKFLAYLFSSPAGKKYFLSCAKQSTNLASINSTQLRNFPLVFPSIHEQKAIAAALSTWDEAIEKTERLIKLKEDHFRWLGIQIFKNSKIKSWNFSTLGQLVKVKKGEQRNRSELDEKGMYPAWNGGITPSGYTDVWNTKENTITISEGGNSCGFVNYCKQKFWCGGHCYSLINENTQISDLYLYFYLKTYEKQLMSLRVGSGLPNIQKADIENFEIAYPNLEEQSEISHNFNLSLNEKNLMKQLLDLYKSQKQGLMQKLLTGKWRVNFKEEK